VDPAGDDQPAVNELLPPRNAGHALTRATQRAPQPPGLRDALAVERCDAKTVYLPRGIVNSLESPQRSGSSMAEKQWA